MATQLKDIDMTTQLTDSKHSLREMHKRPKMGRFGCCRPKLRDRGCKNNGSQGLRHQGFLLLVGALLLIGCERAQSPNPPGDAKVKPLAVQFEVMAPFSSERSCALSPRAAERFFAIVGAEGHAYAVKGWEPGEPMGTFSVGENLYYWEANAVKLYEKNGVRVWVDPVFGEMTRRYSEGALLTDLLKPLDDSAR